jgi:large repetitive protein
MRKLLFLSPLLMALAIACESSAPVGPGIVKITETTTSTSTSTTTTSTIPVPAVTTFTFSPVTPQVLQVVNFNASGSTPASGRRIVSYSWDFGDGDKKTGVTTTHDYAIAGVYLVTLTVTDDLGQATTNSQPINVRPIPTP